jgi:hypothetical protein
MSSDGRNPGGGSRQLKTSTGNEGFFDNPLFLATAGPYRTVWRAVSFAMIWPQNAHFPVRLGLWLLAAKAAHSESNPVFVTADGSQLSAWF